MQIATSTTVNEDMIQVKQSKEMPKTTKGDFNTQMVNNFFPNK